MSYWLATTAGGTKDHAVVEVMLEEGYFVDNHDSIQYVTLCGIWSPIRWTYLFDPESPRACKKCIARSDRD